MPKSKVQPNPRISDGNMRKEIAMLLNQVETASGKESKYKMLKDGIWSILKQRETKESLAAMAEDAKEQLSQIK